MPGITFRRVTVMFLQLVQMTMRTQQNFRHLHPTELSYLENARLSISKRKTIYLQLLFGRQLTVGYHIIDDGSNDFVNCTGWRVEKQRSIQHTAPQFEKSVQ